jgi:hypothetical protein
MTSQGAVAKSAPYEPQWLWAWSGVCVGYRSGNSLFGCDGLEIGRFHGNEVYNPDGLYLGELSEAYDGTRLTTSLYKKLLIKKDGFVPTAGRAYKQPADRAEELLFCGHESFPSPWMIKNRSARKVS